MYTRNNQKNKDDEDNTNVLSQKRTRKGKIIQVGQNEDKKEENKKEEDKKEEDKKNCERDEEDKKEENKEKEEDKDEIDYNK